MVWQRRHSMGQVMQREWRYICTHRWLMLCIVGVPLLGVLFFTTMLHAGLPERIPIAIVDADHSVASRKIVADLSAQQSVDVVMKCNSYSEARSAMQREDIYGFVLIPERMEQLAWDGKQPCISFYINDAFLIPGSLLYRSFKTMSLLASASIVQDVLLSIDVSSGSIDALLQPITIDLHPLGNPWVNYSVYLSNSFIPALLQLIVLLTTIYTLGREWKHGTVSQWMDVSHGDATLAVVGKMIVYTLLYVSVGIISLGILYGVLRYPFHTPVLNMIAAMILLIASAQSLALVLFVLSPNLPVAFSAASVVGVVSFSLGGFSFPVADMYPSLRPLSYLLPVRHYFLIYVNNALNGYPLYYCRGEYIALLVFVVVGMLFLPLLIRRINQCRTS